MRADAGWYGSYSAVTATETEELFIEELKHPGGDLPAQAGGEERPATGRSSAGRDRDQPAELRPRPNGAAIHPKNLVIPPHRENLLALLPSFTQGDAYLVRARRRRVPPLTFFPGERGK